MSITGKGVRFKRRQGSPWYLSILLLTEVVLSLFVYATLAANVIWPRGTQGAAGVANVLSYEGRLTDASGNALGGSGTDYCFKFSIYDASTAGSKVWPSGSATGQSITVTDGVFDALVGSADTLDYNFFDNDTVYLNVDVATKVGGSCTNGDETYESVTPRQRIAAVGYAFSAANVYSSLLKTDNANDKVQIGTGTGTASQKLLALDVRNSSDTIGSACSVPGSLWYNSANNRALVCDNSTIQEIGNLGTITGIKEASAGSTISSGTVVWSGINGVSISQNAQTMSVSGLNAFGVSNIGNTAGNTGAQTGTIVFSGQNGITLSQITGGGGVHTLGISADGIQTISNYSPFQASMSATGLNSNAVMSFVPFVLPFNLTATRAAFMASFAPQTSATGTMNGTLSISMALYSRNVSTLSLASSGSGSYAFSNSSNASSSWFNGMRRFTIPMNINATPGEYWYSLWIRSSASGGLTYAMSIMGSVPLATNAAYSGNFGTAFNSSKSPYLGYGIFSNASFTTAIPASVAISNIKGSGNSYLRAPWIIFSNFDLN